MLYWALVCLLIATVTAVLGFGGLALAAAVLSKLLLIVFLVLFLITLATHLARSAG